MKRLVIYLPVLMILLSSCGSNEMLIEQTGDSFIEAVLNDNMEKVRQLVTPETAAKWGVEGEFLDLTLSPEAREQMMAAKHKVTNIVINGNEAKATLVIAIPSIVGDITTLHFRKEGKRWLVNEPGVFLNEVRLDEPVMIE